MSICQAGRECESRRRPGAVTPFQKAPISATIRKVAGTKGHVARFDVQRYGLKIGPIRRGGRVAEGARLESVFTGNRNVGSNPTPSANCRVPSLNQCCVLRPSLELMLRARRRKIVLQQNLPTTDMLECHSVRVWH